uniref:Peptidase M13 C-terminal domain-containing protein n=1 Tax=viral metagenome TaxID=1070528 RepID=A0A6C0HR00_9ZZZZ
MKSRKNFYRDLRIKPKKFKLLDFVKVPIFTKKQKREVTKIHSKKTIDSDLIKLFEMRDSKIQPQNDFYTYVNELWIKNVNKVANDKKTFYVKQDNIRIVQEQTSYSLLSVLELNSNQKRLYDSFKNIESSHMIGHVREMKESLRSIFDKNNFYELMVYMHKNPLFSWSFPIRWDMSINLKNTKVYCNTLSSSDLTFFDFAYYEQIPKEQTTRHMYQQKLIKNYEIYIKNIFKCLEININHTDIFECESSLVQCFNGNMYEDNDGYNKISLSESSKLGFDWKLFTDLMGFKSTPDWYIVSSPNYLSNVMKLMNEWNTPKWQNYWYFICMKQMIKFSKKMSKIDYEFNGKFISGVVKPFPDELRGFIGLAMCYNTLLSKEYSKNFRNENVIEYVKKMAHELREAFLNILLRNKWLTPISKEQAIKKIRYLDFTIGTIDPLTLDPEIEYTNDVWVNLTLQHLHYLSKEITYTNKPYIKDNRDVDWQKYPPAMVGNQNYIVNAFYTPTENAIFIPLGIMQNPFVIIEESLEYNLASIGYTITHEMSHSLDNLGSRYNYKGDLENWWSSKEKKHFDEYLKDVINEYEEFSKRDGVKWDATNSVGEDIADISGLFILEEYLRNKLFLNNEMLEIDILKLKLFFVYFAIQNSQGVYKGALPMLLITNPHPLNKYRVNCPLARVKLFQYLYNIKPGDKMFWKNTSKLW